MVTGGGVVVTTTTGGEVVSGCTVKLWMADQALVIGEVALTRQK